MSNAITGGVFFGAVVQGRDVQVTLPAEITPAMTGLPRLAAVFTGRDGWVESLLSGLEPGGVEGAVSVSAIAGMAGVGKTELALQVADRALHASDWFPGGVLFVDLSGYHPDRRLSASDALSGWLQAIGIPGEHIPANEQDRARLWRSVLSAYVQQGRRLLLIIDNAADTAHVAPLLPIDRNIPVLITSRHTLDIDARLHNLDVLDTDSAIRLIADVVSLRRDDTTWLSDPDQQQAMAELAELCAGLPLALRIVAALLADRPRPASLAASLRDTRHRLDRLARRETTGEVAVRAAFDLSYRHLTSRQARLFRLLPVNPGPDISTPGVARLTNLSVDETILLLQDLHRAHLVDEPSVDRWRMHDLIRLYASAQLPEAPDEVDTARRRLFTYYQDATLAANTHLDPTITTDAARFANRELALSWLEAERSNLIAACTSATDCCLPQTAVDLAFTLARFLGFRRYFDDWITVATVAADICRRLGDQNGEAAGLNSLGLALANLRRFDEAIIAHTRAVDICRRLGNPRGEAGALNNLGVVLRELRRFDEAIISHTRAVNIFREHGDRHSEGEALGNLGLALVELRRFDEAITTHTQYLGICRQLGDRHGESTALNNLGLALTELRRFDEATTTHTQAVDIFRQLGDRHGEGTALGNLGLALVELRRFDEAITAHKQNLEVCRQLGDRHGEGRALNNLGVVLRQMRRFDEMLTAFTEHLEICRELGDRHGESTALNNLGLALTELRRFDKAITTYTQAVDIFRLLGDRHGESAALNNSGVVLRQMRRFDAAVIAHTRDLEICLQVGDEHGEGRALNNLGLVLQQVQQFDAAVTAHKQAADVFRRLGDRLSEARAGGNLGIALTEARRFDEAITTYIRAADIFRQLGNKYDEGTALNDVGLALSEVRRFAEAITAHTRAADIFRQLGNRHSEGHALGSLALALSGLQRYDEAHACWEKAANTFADAGDATTAALFRRLLNKPSPSPGDD